MFSTRFVRVSLPAIILGALTFVAPQSAEAATVLPDFSVATFIPGTVVDNPYFPLTFTGTRVFVAHAINGGESTTERFELTNIGLGPTILGVQTSAQLDRSFEDDLLVEETKDYYAQDTDGNVWYMGEDVTGYVYDDDGNLLSTNSNSAWRAGVNGGLPGFNMPVNLTPGFNYYQEYSPVDGAVDQATIAVNGLTLPTIFGNLTGVVKIFESSELEPDSWGYKYYAPGIGLVLEEEGSGDDLSKPTLSVPLTRVATVPEPATWLMMVFGFGAVGWAARRASIKKTILGLPAAPRRG